MEKLNHDLTIDDIVTIVKTIKEYLCKKCPASHFECYHCAMPIINSIDLKDCHQELLESIKAELEKR